MTLKVGVGGGGICPNLRFLETSLLKPLYYSVENVNSISRLKSLVRSQVKTSIVLLMLCHTYIRSRFLAYTSTTEISNNVEFYFILTKYLNWQTLQAPARETCNLYIWYKLLGATRLNPERNHPLRIGLRLLGTILFVIFF